MTAAAELRVAVGPSFHVGTRFVLLFGGEALQSLLGFGLSVAMARSISARDFGVFSIVILMGGIALAYMRALVGVPAAMTIPKRQNARWVDVDFLVFGSAAVAIAIALGVVAGLVLWIWLRGSDDAAVVALAGATYVAPWSLRSFVRGAVLVERRVGLALAGDAAFTISGVLLSLILARMLGGLVGVLAALALASLLGIAIVLVFRRRRIGFSLRRPVVRRYRVFWPALAWSAAGVTTASLQAQCQAALVAALAGPAAYAPIAAGLTLLAPLRLATSALVSLIQPNLSEAISKPGEQLRRVLSRGTLTMLTLGLAYGLVLLLTLPSMLRLLFAHQFDHAPMSLIVQLLFVISLTFMLYAPPRTLLELRGAFRQLTKIIALSIILGLPVVIVLLRWSDPAWSLLGLLVSEVVILVACWLAVLRRRPAGGAYA